MTVEMRDLDHFRAAVLDDKTAVRDSFRRHLDSELDQCIRAMHSAYCAFRDLEAELPDNHRNAITEFYLFQAINSLLTSLALMITGRLVPSGNLMRHYGESTAMALLLSHKDIPEFDRYMQAPRTYPVHKAMAAVSRRRYARLLGINAANWQEFVAITGFYDQYSHPSALVLADTTLFSLPGHVSLGGDFDPDKLPQYEIEFKRRTSAADVLRHGVPIIGGHLRAAA